MVPYDRALYAAQLGHRGSFDGFVFQLEILRHGVELADAPPPPENAIEPSARRAVKHTPRPLEELGGVHGTSAAVSI